jgi:hypothetical protein
MNREMSKDFVVKDIKGNWVHIDLYRLIKTYPNIVRLVQLEVGENKRK